MVQTSNVWLSSGIPNTIYIFIEIYSFEIKVFGSNKIKETKQDSQNRLRSPKGGET
jgi:hypothetical protein